MTNMDADLIREIIKLKDRPMSWDEMWAFMHYVAANFGKEGSEYASFDGLEEALFEEVTSYRLVVTDENKIKQIAQQYTIEPK